MEEVTNKLRSDSNCKKQCGGNRQSGRREEKGGWGGIKERRRQGICRAAERGGAERAKEEEERRREGMRAAGGGIRWHRRWHERRWVPGGTLAQISKPRNFKEAIRLYDRSFCVARARIAACRACSAQRVRHRFCFNASESFRASARRIFQLIPQRCS